MKPPFLLVVEYDLSIKKIFLSIFATQIIFAASGLR
jgi:hypothetical protein